MTVLDHSHRKTLEQTVRRARRIAEAGARQAMEHLAVANNEPRAHLSPDQRLLRNRLRAHARQLGDKRDARGTQQIDRIIEQCAYEHWHRMLFARFLAENGLLIEPASGVPISLTDCRELAAQRGKPWIELASEYAVRMLSQVFRLDDPVLELHLPAEHRADMEALLEALPVEVFTATDSLGWTYQFWQADAKDAVNASEVKIGARELAPVTQLFTEDYMVDFLLQNTLGAWWAGKLGTITASSETEARARASLPARNGLPAVEWQYLRLVAGDIGTWRPAAGTFGAWPKSAREITILDPCMGSGHFLVFALPLLARLRMEEEHLSGVDAVDRVLRENLFGLELDDRCTQIAAFNLALMAWRSAGYRVLPQLNLACSGLSISASEDEWIALAGSDTARIGEMRALYQAFKNAPFLGSLIDPRSIVRSTWADSPNGDDQEVLFEADQHSPASLLNRAVERPSRDESFHELAVTAHGVAKAAAILGGAFTLVTTNVPYLGRGKQSDELKKYAALHHARAKADLATCFVERCLAFCASGGSTALVTPENWLFLGTYKNLRKYLLTERQWNAVARLGAKAFETPMWDFNVALLEITQRVPRSSQAFAGLDASAKPSARGKAWMLRDAPLLLLPQHEQLRNPDHRVAATGLSSTSLLSRYASSYVGLQNGDSPRFIRMFWEARSIAGLWEAFQLPCAETAPYGGRRGILRWENGDGELTHSSGCFVKGREAWGRRGVAIRHMGRLPATLYTGELYDQNSAVIVAHDEANLPAIWAFCSSSGFNAEVRKIDRALKVTNATLVKVSFDLEQWRARAAQQFPNGLPKPSAQDPTQWLFTGHPRFAQEPLQVAVARLVGYRWPRQTGSSFHDCPALEPDGLESFAESDGIVCLNSLRGEEPASSLLERMLASAYGGEWSTAQLSALLNTANSARTTIGEWLRDQYFEEHCALFEQRPFVWHVWDGRQDGFGALVNYHSLAGPDGEGRRTLEKLAHTYLGDWIARQRAAVGAHHEGADARLAAAEHLREQLLKILGGEPPFDIFVRWKELHQQPIGWEPDINDGVRVNIRPFMMAKPLNARATNACILRATPRIKWDKDRGKEPKRAREQYPWFWGWDGRTQDFEAGREFDGTRSNDLHYTRARKERARLEHRAIQWAMR